MTHYCCYCFVALRILVCRLDTTNHSFYRKSASTVSICCRRLLALCVIEGAFDATTTITIIGWLKNPPTVAVLFVCHCHRHHGRLLSLGFHSHPNSGTVPSTFRCPSCLTATANYTRRPGSCRPRDSS